VVNYVPVSTSSGDYSQYVTQAQQNGAQGMVLGIALAQANQIAASINQLSPKIDWVSGSSGFSLNQLKGLGQFAKKALWVGWTPGIDDVKDFPGLKQPIADLTANMKGANVNNMTAVALVEWLVVHAFSQVMENQSGAVTPASVLAAFTAAKDIPMNGIIKPWTPTDYQDAGTFKTVFANVSNPWMYKGKYTGKATRTSPKTLFSTFTGLSGSS
jgi:ABC-type branched-subunit amino acid transport system substrate-binding protein